MGDHFVLLVDRLLTESTLEAAIGSRNRSLQATASAVDDTKVFGSSTTVDLLSPRKIVECRICQDEDEDSNMETPCSCCGSLEYAHRRCVQRWCNEKGNTTCEICHQQFKPGYTAPPPLFQIRHLPMNLRANWDIYRRELNDSRFIAVVSTDRHYDEYSVSTTRSSIYYRTVAIVLMLLLILRHTLPVILTGSNEYTFQLFTVSFVLVFEDIDRLPVYKLALSHVVQLLLLPIVGIILPIYLMVKAVGALRHCRQQQEAPNSLFTQSDEETEHSTMQAQPHIVNIL
ncbi:probable E3 ubiquitin ligase SUD1 isoform X1 [Gossypium raimondii]|uniref:Uncharacterized protein n=1 Tax=Gossypium raimondii TaxID=29730 RepID=A0A0D2PTZ7_GOSRA|nr:probable E3 ubiquitin ligase SUD1 isoform X1 [Gossypium raimondii]XP_012479089.1 probable E3 ubiquitin ligase SUD1 isoform X1 [Gossypium raimondii]KJB30843.1 hypothetical protein B456_005G163500 [Gossypium raimondii]